MNYDEKLSNLYSLLEMIPRPKYTKNWSYSQLGSYGKDDKHGCPFKWKLKYIDKIYPKSDKQPHFELGKFIHTIMQKHFTDIYGNHSVKLHLPCKSVTTDADMIKSAQDTSTFMKTKIFKDIEDNMSQCDIVTAEKSINLLNKYIGEIDLCGYDKSSNKLFMYDWKSGKIPPKGLSYTQLNIYTSIEFYNNRDLNLDTEILQAFVYVNGYDIQFRKIKLSDILDELLQYFEMIVNRCITINTQRLENFVSNREGDECRFCHEDYKNPCKKRLLSEVVNINK